VVDVVVDVAVVVGPVTLWVVVDVAVVVTGSVLVAVWVTV